MDVAGRYRQPVAPRLCDEPPGLFDIREAQARFEQLVVGGERASTFPQDRAKLRLTRDTRLMSDLDRPVSRSDVVIEVQL